jgi:titin
VTLNWDTATGSVTGYKVEISTNGFDWTTVDTPTATTSTITSLTNGVWYYFHVSAVTAIGAGAPSTIAAKPADVAGQPTALTATVSGNNTIALGWNAPVITGGSAIRNYKIEVSTDAGITWDTVTATVLGTSYSYTSQSAAPQLLFRVSAINAVGTGPVSTSVAIGAVAIPSAPTALVVTPSTGALALSWTAPSETVTAYRIEYGIDGATWSLAAGNAPSTPTSYTINGLTNGISYFVRISALNPAGTGIGLVGTGTPAIKSSAPVDLTALTASRQITLTWSAPGSLGGGSLLGYTVQISTDGTTWETATANTGTTSTNITINQFAGSALVGGTVYYARVAAVTNLGTGDFTSSIQALLVETVSAVETLTAVSGNQQITLNWTSATGTVSGYRIERSVNGTEWTTLGTLTPGVRTYTATGLTNGIWYYFRISTTSAAGDKSSVIAAKPVTLAGAPTGILASPSGNNSVAISWSAPTNTGGAGIKFYKIEVTSDAGSSWTLLSDSVLGRAYIYESATAGESVAFRLSAITSVGAGESATSSSVIVIALPDVPTALVITPSSGSLGLAWTAPSQAVTGYKVEYSTNGAVWISATNNTNGTGTTFTINALTNGTNYFVRVSGINGAGIGYGIVGSGTPATAASAPISLAATGGVGSVTLTWSAPTSNGGSSVIGYRVDSSLDGSTWDSVTANTMSNGTSLTITSISGNNLITGTPYQFRLAAITSLGLGAYGETVTATSIEAVTAVDTLTAVSTSGEIVLNWFAASGSVSGYVVEVSTTGSTWMTLTTTNSSTLTYTANGLNNGTWYYFRVSATSSAGQGASAVIAAKPMSIPDAPTSISATGIINGVALSWSAPTNNGGSAIVGYMIEESVNSGVWTVTNANTGNSATSANLTNTSGTVSYRVSAINAVGAGSASTSATASTVPAAPGAVGVISLNPINAAIAVSWSAASGSVSDYLIEQSTDGATWSQQSVAYPNTSETLTALTNGTNYLVRVSARNNGGYGPVSIGTATPRTAPTAPTNLAATAVQTIATLTWNAPTNIGGAPLHGYLIEQSADSGATWTVFRENTNTSGTTINFSVTTGTYQYRVAAITKDAFGSLTSAYSNTAVLTSVQVVTGITNLVATAGNTSVLLTWAPSIGALNYKVESMRSGTPWTLVDTPTASISTITDLINGAVYYFRVSAVNSAGTSSAVTTAITPFGGASAPNITEATAYGMNIYLKWNAPTNLNGAPVLRYKITAVGSSGTIVETTTSTATTYNLVTRVAGSYSVTVAAITGSPRIVATGIDIAENSIVGESSTSQSVTTTLNSASTMSPVGISAIRANPRVAGQRQSLRIEWTAPAGVNVQNYLLQVQTTASLGFGADKWRALNIANAVANNTPNVVGMLGMSTSETMVATALLATTFFVDVDGICSVDISTFAASRDCGTITQFSSAIPYVFQVSAYTGSDTISLKSKRAFKTANSEASPNQSGTAGSFTFVQLQDAPSQVDRPSAMPVAPNQIAVSWNPALDNGSPITGYTTVVIIRDAVNQDRYETLTAVSGTSMIYQAMGASTDLYSFCVIATNSIGDSYVSECSAAVSAVSRPTAIADALTATVLPIGSDSVSPIRLNWQISESSTVLSWDIEYSYDGLTWAVADQVPAGESSTATLRNLIGGKPVQIRIAAVNQAGLGTFSSTASMALGTPDLPTVGANSANAGAFLYWRPSLDTKGRSIANYLVTNADDTPVVGECANVGLNTACKITGLTNEQAYTFKVTAQYWDSIGSETLTVSSTTTVTPAAGPAKPVLEVGSPIEGNGVITFAWRAGTAMTGQGSTTGYVVQRLTSTGGADGAPITIPVTGLVETVTINSGLINGITYMWQIFATNANGAIKSEEPLFISATPRGVPGDVTNLIVIPSSQKVDISWTSPSTNGGSAITAYDVVVTQSSVVMSSPLCVTTQNFCSVTDLTNGESVTVTVKARNSVGSSANFAEAQATPDLLSDPVSNLAFTSPTSNAVTLTWTSPSAATGVRIDRGASTIVNSSNVIVWTRLDTTGALNSYTDSSVPTNGDNYFYSVTPTNGNSFGRATVITANSRGQASTVRNLAVHAGDSEINVSWNAPANNGGYPITGYEVEYAEESDWSAWAQLISPLSDTQTSVVIDGLTNGVGYKVRVYAITQFGPGESITSLSEVVPLPVPGTVANVVATPGTGTLSSQVTLTWDKELTATGYYVEISDALNPIRARVTECNISDPDVTTCVIRRLMTGHTYYFYVYAINASGDGARASVQVSTNSVGVPNVPETLAQITGIVAVQQSGTNADKVDLSWNALQYAETYTVRVGISGTGVTTLYRCANTTATICVVQGLIGGNSYVFEVIGTGTHPRDGFGQSVPASVTLALPVYTPPAPPTSGGVFFAPAPVSPVPAQLPISATLLTARAGDRQVELTWVAVADTNRSTWEIESSLDGTNWTAVASPAGTATTAAIGNLINGTSYIFRIIPSGTGGKNLPVTASAMPGIAAAAPLGFTATPGDSSVILNWTAPVNTGGLPIKSYVVEQNTTGNTWSEVASVDMSSLSAYVSNLTNFTAYNFRVSAVTNFGKGASATITASPSVLPTAALTLKLVSVGPGTVTVGWEPVTGGSASTISGYRVEYSADGLVWTTSTTTIASITSATVSGLTNGKTYQIRVSPVTATGIGASSVILGTPATRPDAVTNLVATPSSSKMTLTFARPKNTGGYGIDYYIVEAAPAASGPWTVAVENSGSELTRIDIPGLANTRTYFFRVTAVNQVGKGAVSAVVSAAPGAAASAPTLRTFVISARDASISWTVPRDNGGKAIRNYVVEVSLDGKRWTTAVTTAVGTRSARIPLTRKAQLMRIRAVTSYGKGVPSLGVRLPGTGA